LIDEGEYRVIQMSDIENNNLKYTDLSYVNKKIKPHQLVQQGDIVFRSRGTNNTAAIIKEDLINTTAASTLFRIRANQNNIDPEYLLWLINSDISQQYFSQNNKGSYIGMIDKETLENLAIPLPSLAAQKLIGRLNQLSYRESQILTDLAAKKRTLYSTQLQELVEGSY
jgi:restriction endonuclease S subunit